MNKKVLQLVRQILFYVFLAVTAVYGILLYRLFLAYVPGVNLNDLIVSKVGLSPFLFFGISAGILFAIPLILGAFELFIRFSTSYVSYLSENGVIHLSDISIASFIRDIVSDIAGVENLDVSVDIFTENRVGIRIWLNTDEKSDFVRFSERVQQRVLQDLEFNFGIKRIKFFHVYVETTNIQSGAKGYQVKYD